MSFDDFFIVLVAAGVVLSAAYIRAEYRLWRNQGDAERRRASLLRKLHAASMSQQQGSHVEPSLVQLQKFTDTLPVAGDEVAAGDAGRRSQVRSGAQRNQPFAERRARERHQATH